MNFDLPTLFRFIPKLAGSLLIIIGILIVVELRYMLKPHQNEKEKSHTQTPEEEQLAPLKFSTAVETPKMKGGLPDIPVSHRVIITTIIILVLLTVSLLGIHYVFVVRKPEEPEQHENIPLVAKEQAKPAISVYQIGSDGLWNPLTESDLKQLLRGEKIKVAVKYPEPLTQAEFVINGESFVTDGATKSPEGNVYIDYTIPEDKSNFHIEVYVY